MILAHSVTWEEDFADRMNPTLLTTLLHEAIPVLKSVRWQVIEVGEGDCITQLPLCYESTNQHGTHQAALISLSADYTGGIALASLLRGVPFAGVHRYAGDESAALWLAAMNVKYLSPSTGHLTGTCQVPAEVAAMIRSRYAAKKRSLVSLDVQFTSNDEVVAEAQMKYFVQPSSQLTPTREQPRISPLFKVKLKASARIIAGIRAAADRKMTRLDAGHEHDAAGPHGRLLATRLKKVLPQLEDVVLARTSHIDQTLLSIPNLKQVVLFGVGLDLRPFRLNDSLGKPKFFEVDLAEMLAERERTLSRIKDLQACERYSVAADFKTDDIAEVMSKVLDFDASLPTAFVFEGCSMYFSAEENFTILSSISKLMQSDHSRLWCDLVTEGVVERTSGHEEISHFLDGMEQLGERFIFGCDDPNAFMDYCGFDRTDVVSAKTYLNGVDPALATYQFAVAAKESKFVDNRDRTTARSSYSGCLTVK